MSTAVPVAASRHCMAEISSVSRRLAAWGSGLTYDQIPGDVIALAKLRMLDAIGVRLAATRSELGAAARRLDSRWFSGDSASSTTGGPLVPAQSHVRLAHPDTNGGAKLLRRGYSFVDGSDDLGRLDAGLYFLAYQRDPRAQFVRIQQRLAGKHNDAMNEYITHVASGLYAVPPGVQTPGDWWGRALFNT